MTDSVRYPHPWQETEWMQLESLLAVNRLPHALLLSGLADIGKAAFAQAFMQRVLCRSPKLSYACGQCKSCQLYAAGHHPDVHVVGPKDEGKAIGIDSVRELCGHLNKTAQQGGWKVALIAPAEAMTRAAANALLKNLEEPVGDTAIMLLSHEPHRLLPTIRSRCRQVRFPIPASDKVMPWLRVASGRDEVDGLLLDAGGRPLLAMMFNDDDYLKKRTSFRALIDRVTAGDLAAFGAAELLASERLLNLSHSLDWFEAHVVELARRLQTDDERSATVDLVGLHRFYERLLQVRRALNSSANPDRRLLWEQLLLEWSRLCVRGGLSGLELGKSTVLS